MDKRKTVCICVLIFLVLKIFLAETEINADNFLLYRYSGKPQDSFALNGKQIRITRPRSSLLTAWIGHDLQPSAGKLVFSAASTGEKRVSFYVRIRMRAYHFYSADKCKGNAKTKIFRRSYHALPEKQEFVMPLQIESRDLLCGQCGKMVKHAAFNFYFGTEASGGVEVSPFTLKTAFRVTPERKKNNSSPHLANVVRNGFEISDTQKVPPQGRLARNVLELSGKAGFIQKQYQTFRPVLELLQKKEYLKAVETAEKMASENTFCQILLYLVYSRGDCGIRKNNVRAAGYFNRLIGSFDGKEPGFMFWLHEYKYIWKKYRLQPLFPDEKVTLKAWDPNGLVMDEIVPLRGKYPLKNCYEERMRSLGGVGARTVFLVAREQKLLRPLLEEARRLGSAEAWAGRFSPFDARGLKPERTPLAEEVLNKPDAADFAALNQAAELGFVPAKLLLAKVLLTENHSPRGFDFAAAEKLLKDSIFECEKYAENGCSHAGGDLRYARELLSVVPPAETPVPELIRRYDAVQMESFKGGNLRFSQFKAAILAEMICRKKDHPESLYFQALKLPRSQNQQKTALFRTAAGKGSLRAIRFLLSGGSSDRQYWYFLFLAGKYKLFGNNSSRNYFDEAYLNLQQKRFQMPHPEYLKALSVLASYHKQAEAEYRRLSKKLEFDISVSDRTTVSAEHVNSGGMNLIRIKAEPSTQERWVTVRNKSGKVRGEIFLFTTSSQRSNQDISCEFKDENGRMQKTYPGHFTAAKYFPEELKILIAPRSTGLDLQVRFLFPIRAL